MKLQRSRCFWNLDNVKGSRRGRAGSARAGEFREISLGATCSTSNISFATTYRPGSADLVILRAISAIQKGREFSVSTIHERTSRSRDAGKSVPDKCAVLVLTASGTDREGISFPAQGWLEVQLTLQPSLVFLFPLRVTNLERSGAVSRLEL